MSKWTKNPPKKVRLNLFGEADANCHPLIFSHQQIEDAAFQHFRVTGFPYVKLTPHESMLEINYLTGLSTTELRHTSVAYKVAETYHPHRRHACANGFRSPFDSFQNDKLLRHAIQLELKSGAITPHLHYLGLVTGTQACWNFRPGFALSQYRKYCKPGLTVLDTSTGYGGRLVGFIASGFAGKYIGIDPSTLTHCGNLKMASELGYSNAVELHNLPAEDVRPSDLPPCDFAFTSPPYFSKEHYSEEETQSWKRYKSGESWRVGFLLPMFRLQFAVLKPASISIVNIADAKVEGQIYPLVDWAVDAAGKAGFSFIKREEFPMARRIGTGGHLSDKVATEAILVFQKPKSAGRKV